MSTDTTTEATKADRWADKLRVEMAKNLREIKRLYGHLSAQAYYAATGHDAANLDPINLLGPAADLSLWERRYELAEAAHYARLERGEPSEWTAQPGGDDYASDQVAELHPLLVLATWEDAIRDALGTPTERKASVTTAAGYIGSAVTWMLDVDANGDINFLGVDALANDLRDCRAMLENILSEGRRADTGAPCLDCGTSLVKVWGTTVAEDHWRCKPCEDTLTPERYRLAVRSAYLANADRLTATDMLEAYRIKAGTLMVWAQRGKVRKRGKDDSGRRLYDVADAVKARDAKAEGDDAA